MRCPHCGSLDTKRNGTTGSGARGFDGPAKPLQRFLCAGCGRSFTPRRSTVSRPGARFTDEVVREAVRRYVQGLSSYRVLAVMLTDRLGQTVSPRMLNRWVDELGGQAATPLEVSARLRPRWGGILGVDGKTVRVRGRRHCLLVAVDQATHDVVHRLVLEAETPEGFRRLVHEAVVEAGYPLRGLVIDGGPGWVEVWENHFARVPLQLCRIHFDRRLDQDIPKLKGSPKAPLHAELKDRIRSVLYADTLDEALDRCYSLVSDRDRFAGVGRYDPLRSLVRHFHLYTAHHRVEGLPADANITENVIKQLNKKLRLMEGFASLGSAERFTRLLVACYRCKRFTDSCHHDRNGRSPLELAGVALDGADWLDLLLPR